MFFSFLFMLYYKRIEDIRVFQYDIKVKNIIFSCPLIIYIPWIQLLTLITELQTRNAISNQQWFGSTPKWFAAHWESGIRWLWRSMERQMEGQGRRHHRGNQEGSCQQAEPKTATRDTCGGGYPFYTSSMFLLSLPFHCYPSNLTCLPRNGYVWLQSYILTKFRHPNILTIYGACFFEERELWIVMEFMEGGNLYEWLHSDLEIEWNVRLRYDKNTRHNPHHTELLCYQSHVLFMRAQTK